MSSKTPKCQIAIYIRVHAISSRILCSNREISKNNWYCQRLFWNHFDLERTNSLKTMYPLIFLSSCHFFLVEFCEFLLPAGSDLFALSIHLSWSNNKRKIFLKNIVLWTLKSKILPFAGHLLCEGKEHWRVINWSNVIFFPQLVWRLKKRLLIREEKKRSLSISWKNRVELLLKENRIFILSVYKSWIT